jgi:hypothetical protein
LSNFTGSKHRSYTNYPRESEQSELRPVDGLNKFFISIKPIEEENASECRGINKEYMSTPENNNSRPKDISYRMLKKEWIEEKNSNNFTKMGDNISVFMVDNQSDEHTDDKNCEIL